MAQKAIREFDAKSLRYSYIQKPYSGVLVYEKQSLDSLTENLSSNQYRVVKPDQLFGKRGKHGLLGVKLSSDEIKNRIQTHRQKKITIDNVSGILDTFLIEPFVDHEQEWYIAIKTDRTSDVIYFSHSGGIEVEENRESVQELSIPVLEKLDEKQILDAFGKLPEAVNSFIVQLFEFFRKYGFTYLEINPFTLDSTGNLVCLDMVAKIDTCEAGKQKNNRKNIGWVKPFGTVTHPLEKKIEEMDAETGASLKFSTLNTKGCISLLLGGGGASVITMDKLGNLGLLSDTINYGELSGNPNYRHNKVYVQGLIDLMCENNHEKQWLCLIGGISNFTRIDILAKAFVDALTDRVDDLKKHNIHLLVRRGGVRDQEGLALIETFCETYDIPYSLADGNVYLTKALEHLQS